MTQIRQSGWFIALIMGAMIAGGGCGASKPKVAGPQAVVAAYARAIEAGDYMGAYGMMSHTYRKQNDPKSFIQTLQDNPSEIKFLLGQMKKTAQKVTVAAQVEFGSSDQLRLIQERGQWCIVNDPIDFYPQQTPELALRSFVRAIENKRYKILLRFVPARRAGSLTVEVLKNYFEGEEREEAQALVRGLKANFNAPIHKSGNVATMPYGERDVVKFVREDGIWKVENPH